MAGRRRGWPAWREQNLDYACRIFPAELSGRGFDSPHLHQQRANGGHRGRRSSRLPPSAARRCGQAGALRSRHAVASLGGDFSPELRASSQTTGCPPRPSPACRNCTALSAYTLVPPFVLGPAALPYQGAGKTAANDCPQSTTPERTHPGAGMVQYCQARQTLLLQVDRPTG
jgi:hypothetical protein